MIIVQKKDILGNESFIDEFNSHYIRGFWNATLKKIFLLLIIILFLLI